MEPASSHVISHVLCARCIHEEQKKEESVGSYFRRVLRQHETQYPKRSSPTCSAVRGPIERHVPPPPTHSNSLLPFLHLLDRLTNFPDTAEEH